MPMPKPQKGEKKEDFVARFMGNETMVKDYPDEKQRYAICMQEWKDKSKEFEADMETVNFNDVEIFSTGRWEGKGSAVGGDNIDEQFLDSLVSSFSAVGKEVKPRLVITHDKKKSEGIMGTAALGWITGLRRNGNKLFADIKNVPKKLASLIDAKAFGRFSPGIYTSLNVNGATHNNVLEHVALLGADLPANTDVDGFIDLYYQSETVEANEHDMKIYTNIIQEKSMDENVIMEFQKREADLKAEKENLIGQLKAFEDEKSQLNEKLVAYEKAQKESFAREVDSFIDSMSKEGKIVPAQVEFIKSLSKDAESFNHVKAIIAANSPVEFGKAETSNDQPEKKNDDDLESMVKEYAKEHNLSYREAFKEIAYQKGGSE
jgi:hypothetical protein